MNNNAKKLLGCEHQFFKPFGLRNILSHDQPFQYDTLYKYNTIPYEVMSERSFQKANDITAVETRLVVRTCVFFSLINIKSRGVSRSKQSHCKILYFLRLLSFSLLQSMKCSCIGLI